MNFSKCVKKNILLNYKKHQEKHHVIVIYYGASADVVDPLSFSDLAIGKELKCCKVNVIEKSET